MCPITPLCGWDGSSNMKTRKSTLTPLAVTREECAELLSCSPRSISYLIADGRLKAKKHGKNVRIPYTEIERLSKIDIGPIRPRNNNRKGKVINGQAN
jgi:excisionase family DNA binding protein